MNWCDNQNERWDDESVFDLEVLFVLAKGGDEGKYRDVD